MHGLGNSIIILLLRITQIIICRTGGKHLDVSALGLATATPEEAEKYDFSRRWGLPRELDYLQRMQPILHR